MLIATLSVTPSDDALELTLSVANEGDEPVELDFRDAQRVDFTAYDADSGEEVWRWSDGRMFGQVLGSEEIPAGESLEYQAEWAAPPSGSYRVEGELVDTERQPSAEMVVELD
jgi:hypothetical protein